MLFDLEPYLPFNVFLTIALLAIISIGFFVSDKKGK